MKDTGEDVGGSVDSNRTTMPRFCVCWMLTKTFVAGSNTKYGKLLDFAIFWTGVLRLLADTITTPAVAV